MNRVEALSQEVLQETQSLHVALEDLAHTARATHVRVNNTFNAFLNLSYYQYIENVRSPSLALVDVRSP